MLRWYVIHTKGGGETTAALHLRRQGYEVYLPRVVETVRRRSRWRERMVALFPRYLFLRLNQGTQALAPVRSTRGVSDIVRFGSRYATVPDELIRSLQQRADADTGLHRLSPSFPTPGSSVRLINGPFDGIEGVFECTSGDDRVVVLLNLLGRSTRVHVPLRCISPTLALAAYQ